MGKDRKPRRLKSEEMELWQKIARTTRPMHPLRTEANRWIPEKGKSSSDETQATTSFVLAPFQIGSGKQQTSPPPPGKKLPAPNVDRGVYRKLKRGKTRPEARIDLHGMTVATAQHALREFLIRARDKGKRTVLVITGKGRQQGDAGPIPTRPGVLRQSLPHWVASPPLNGIVQEIVEAHPRHGGSGAYYVFLRRAK